MQSRGALPFFTRFYVALPILLPAQPARRGGPMLTAREKLSEFGVRAGDNDDLVFVTSDSISIFVVTMNKL